jgi:hypothetical protein
MNAVALKAAVFERQVAKIAKGSTSRPRTVPH